MLVAQEGEIMSINVTCSKCKKELTGPGGLAFSPPLNEETWDVKKKHLCACCWKAFEDWLCQSSRRKMDKIEESIREILKKGDTYNYQVMHSRDDLIKEICQLFEPREQSKLECQARMKRILEIIGEDFVEMVANLYMNNKNRARTFELWRSIKKKALKKQYLNKLRDSVTKQEGIK